MMDMNFTLEGYINNRNLSVRCTGIIRDYDGFKAFKKKLFEIAETDEIEHLKNKTFDVLEIKFINSHPLPDCLIGFLLKLKDRDEISVNLITNNNKMLSFFMSIFLDEKFDVKLFL